MKVKRSSVYALHALIYMVRHSVQLPVTPRTMAKAEGMPSNYLVKVFQQLSKRGFVKTNAGKKRGYVFARPPDDISLLELLESIEGSPLFEDCPLRHCECGGTPENCPIFSVWVSATRRIKDLLEETSVAAAAHNYPEHPLLSLPEPGS